MHSSKKLLLAAAGLVVPALPAFGATALYYVGPDGGNWNNAANWSTTDGGPGGAGIPTSADDAELFNHGAASRSLNLDADESVQNFFMQGSPSGPVVFNQSANTLQLAQSLNIAGGSFGATYNQSGGAVTVAAGGTLSITGPSTYNLSGGTLTTPALTNDGTIQVSSGGTLNASSISGSGQVQYASSANLDGGTISQPISTAPNTTITKQSSATAIITGTQSYGANTTYEADLGTTIFGSPFASSSSAATLTIHGNTTHVVFDLARTIASPDLRHTFAAGVIYNTPGEGILTAGDQETVGTNNLSIDVADGGSMDVNDNTFLLQTGDSDHNAAKAAQLMSWLHTGYNGGAWNGLGILSSVAASTPGHALGLFNNDNGSGTAIYSSFHNNSVDAHSLLIQYTYAGDSTVDGALDATDFDNWLAGFQHGGTTWALGDFTYDGAVDIPADFKQLAQGWYAEYGNDSALKSLVDSSSLTPAQQTEADAIIATTTPEPSGIAIAFVSLSACLLRRRRHSTSRA